MAATIITTGNFEEEVINQAGPVLVDFWAEWCGPCKMLLPVVEQVAEENPDLKICKVNVDENPELAQRFKVMTIPTLLVFKNGEVTDTSIGVVPKDKITSMLGK
ncbi:thioredoxin [Lachnospiraceae bacterium KM106-2]|nr:thioredoxin [Lachnospiraceae bacterium KM106-2]